MSDQTLDISTVPDAGQGFEWWMTSNFAMGAAFAAFIALLIPPYVTEVTSDAAAAGTVMAIISLAAVLGPVLGTFADRYAAHRLIMSLGIVGLSIGFAAFGLASEKATFYAIDSIILGVSLAAVAAIGPVFVVGAGLSQRLEARRMTWYSLAMPAGQVVGGVMIGVAAAAGWSYSARFWIASGFTLILAIVTWATSKGAEERLHAAMYGKHAGGADADVSSGSEKKLKVPLKTVLWSSFGLFLLVSMLSSISNNGINSQISNIMPQVYGVSEAETSTLIAVAGLLNLALFIPAGRLMARHGNINTYSIGVILRLVGALGMAVIGLVAENAVVLAIAFMQILYQASPFARLAQPGAAVRFASFPAGIANGWLIAASAMGGFIGSLLGGVLAAKYGFNAVNWMGAAAAGLSVIVLIVGIWPKRQPDDNDGPVPVPPGAAAAAELN
jgi:predicted MFS family arabinose efflux permease